MKYYMYATIYQVAFEKYDFSPFI